MGLEDIGPQGSSIDHGPMFCICLLYWGLQTLFLLSPCVRLDTFFCDPDFISHTELNILLNKWHHRIKSFKSATGATHVDHRLAVFTPTSRLSGSLFFQKDTLFKTVNQKASYPGGQHIPLKVKWKSRPLLHQLHGTLPPGLKGGNENSAIITCWFSFRWCVVWVFRSGISPHLVHKGSVSCCSVWKTEKIQCSCTG